MKQEKLGDKIADSRDDLHLILTRLQKTLKVGAKIFFLQDIEYQLVKFDFGEGKNKLIHLFGMNGLLQDGELFKLIAGEREVGVLAKQQMPYRIIADLKREVPCGLFENSFGLVEKGVEKTDALGT